ncbi:hypothetical protein RCO48_20920 [Peribacillus frigoritolerans]|nr:hypothetical protein [Peribacillus frigoritolerans]
MVRYGLILNHDFKEDLVILHVFFTFYMDGTLIRLKKFATLLPNYWLAETPKRRLRRGGLADSRRKGADF